MKNQKRYRIIYLILIIAIQYVVRFFILKPFYTFVGVPLQMPEWLFALLAIASVCIALGGFFIADYYNERQSRPLPVGEKQESDKYYTLFFIFSIIGCGLGIFVGWKIQFLNLGILYVIYATALYFYALRYRLLTFWGNFILALMAGLLIVNVWLFEFFSLVKNPMDLGLVINSPIIRLINTTIILYALFCFALIFSQQIVKDVIKSPEAPSGANTFPIRYGAGITKNILAISLFLLIVVSISFILYFMKVRSSYFLVGGIFIVISELILLFKVIRMKPEIENFKSLEYLFFIIFILGLLILIIS